MMKKWNEWRWPKYRHAHFFWHLPDYKFGILRWTPAAIRSGMASESDRMIPAWANRTRMKCPKAFWMFVEAGD